MRLFNNILRNIFWQLLAVSQITLLILCTPALAAIISTSTSGTEAVLTKYEQIVFGKNYDQTGSQTKSVEARLDAIETNLFGSVKTGTTKSRLNAIAKLVGNQQPSLLMPPLAGQLDTSTTDQSIHSISSLHNNGLDASYNTSPTLHPNKVNDLLAQAMQKYAAGDTSNANSLFQRVLSIEPNNADAHYNLGAIAEGRGDLEGALSHYQAAVQANPNDPEIEQAVRQVQQEIQNRKSAQDNTKQIQQAAVHKQYLKQLGDDAAQAYKNRNYDEAIHDLQQVANESPNDAGVLFGLAQAWRGKGDLNRARNYLNQAVSIDPNNSLYHSALADLDHTQSNQQIASTQDNAPAGQITPFQGIDNNDNSDTGFQRTGSSNGWSNMNGYGNGSGSPTGVAFSSGSGYHSSQNRIARVVTGSLTGAAIGGLMGGITHSGVGGGAMRGAVFGGLAGLIFGGW